MSLKVGRIGKKDIEQLFKKGRYITTPHLTLKFLNNLNFNEKSKISFITPKTVSKKAVERNILRRRGYAILKNNLIKIPDNFIGVIIFGKKSCPLFGGRKTKKNNPFVNLSEEIKNLFEKYYKI